MRGFVENNDVLLLAATNHPSDIDEAIRQRFKKRLYVRLPDLNTRIDILKKVIKALLHKNVPNKE